MCLRTLESVLCVCGTVIAKARFVAGRAVAGTTHSIMEGTTAQNLPRRVKSCYLLVESLPQRQKSLWNSMDPKYGARLTLLMLKILKESNTLLLSVFQGCNCKICPTNNASQTS